MIVTIYDKAITHKIDKKYTIAWKWNNFFLLTNAALPYILIPNPYKPQWTSPIYFPLIWLTLFGIWWYYCWI